MTGEFLWRPAGSVTRDQRGGLAAMQLHVMGRQLLENMGGGRMSWVGDGGSRASWLRGRTTVWGRGGHVGAEAAAPTFRPPDALDQEISS